MTARTLADLPPDPAWRDPILIIGAGPVGMTAALGLAHYGIPALILDEDEGPCVEGSRAIFMERHALEILGAWSPVGRQMAEQGMTLLAGRVFFRSTELYKTFSAPPDPNIRYPRFVNFPQNTLERLQYEALCATPLVSVRWRHKVTGVSQDDAGVTVEAQTTDGPVSFLAPYALACDGPHSATRHLLKLPFPGESRERHFLILDVRMQLETPRERWFWFDPPFNPGRTALLHPQPDSIYRIDYQLAADDDFAAVQAPEAIHQRIVATVGERPYEVVWKSVYTYQQRMLERFKHGRVFFLGDAAHLMSPFGGRGLNSGVQDVWNLVWKLALVRAGAAPDALLETYDAERQPAAQENLRLTADTMRFLVPTPGPARWRRDAILRLSLPLPAMRKRVNAGHMSNPYTYRHSPIIVDDAPQAGRGGQRGPVRGPARGPAVGSLAPELVVADADGAPLSLLDLFGESFVVFAFSDDADAGGAALASVIPNLPARLPVSLYVVAPRPATSPAPEGVGYLLDGAGALAAAYGASDGTLYIIRPDRHIAARRLRGDMAGLAELPALLRRTAGLELAQTPQAAQARSARS